MITVDPLAKSATLQSSEVGFIVILADVVSMGVPAFGGIGIVSGSTDGAFGTVGLVGWIALIVVVLAGRGDRVERWTTGATRPFGRPTGSVPVSDGLSDS